MNHGFLDARGRNNNHRKKKTTDTGTCSALGSDGILNDATYRVDAAMKLTNGINHPILECSVADKADVADPAFFGGAVLELHEEPSA
nr:hypothetical protein [Tanacetum cinerariifolium]